MIALQNAISCRRHQSISNMWNPNLQLTVLWARVRAVGPAREIVFKLALNWLRKKKSNAFPALTTFASSNVRLKQLKSHITHQMERMIRNGIGMCGVLMRNSIMFVEVIIFWAMFWCTPSQRICRMHLAHVRSWSIINSFKSNCHFCSILMVFCVFIIYLRQISNFCVRCSQRADVCKKVDPRIT